MALLSGLFASSAADARGHDGTGNARIDPRAVNGDFGEVPNRWVSATSGGWDVTVRMTEHDGTFVAQGGQTFSGCGPCVRDYTVLPFKGRFTSAYQDNVCTYYRMYTTPNPSVVCYDRFGSTLYAGAPSETGTSFTYAMPDMATGGSRGFAVGDFDGDGFDEIVTYRLWDGSHIQFWRYDRPSGRFVERPEMTENLGGFNAPGGVRLFAGNFFDDDGLTKHDDLAIYNLTTHTVGLFVSRSPGGAFARFWGWYTDLPLGITGDDEVSVARYDGSALDALVVHTASGTGNRGALRAWNLAWPVTDVTASVSRGDFQTSAASGFTGNAHLVWGSTLRNDPTRDDAFQFLDDIAQYHALYADPAGTGPFGLKGTWKTWYIQNSNYLRFQLGLL